MSQSNVKETEHGAERGAASGYVAAMLLINLGLFVAAIWVHVGSGSQLVLAQGSDSLLDIAAGIILGVSVWVGSQPGDDNHPYGHDRAEPIGALVTAILAGVLAFEVLRSAVMAMIAGDVARMDVWVVGVLGAKFVLKAGMLVSLRMRAKSTKSSALQALRVDARNDLVACATSLGGFGLARAGITWADAALAAPVALYIGYSGFELARENIRYLMGEAPEAEVLDELRAKAAKVAGVIEVGRLRAQFAGPSLHVEVDILIGDKLSATQGHDIAVEVQHSLEGHDLVGQVYVHIDTEEARDHH